MKSKKTSTPKQVTGKEIRSKIEEQLEKALIGWKGELGEKKFKKRIKRAGKLFGKKLEVSATKSKAKEQGTKVVKKKKAV